MATGGGRVEAIFIGSDRQGPLHAEDQVDVVPGKGIRGDRYFLAQGTYSDIDEPGRDLTLFEAEALDGLLADTGIELAPNEIRRNVMTRGIALNALVGRHFRVGEVEGVGVELCQPCNHLQKMTKPGVLDGLVDRGGLRADVVKGGMISVGDAVEDLGPAEHSSRTPR